jgi:ubiquinone/menaquinone biosynthesis C-methylase UbiE
MKYTNVEVIEADATRMTFPDGLFSAILSFTMLHHVSSLTLQDHMLAEAWRMLRRGGVFAGTYTAPGPELGGAAQAVRELTALALREK